MAGPAPQRAGDGLLDQADAVVDRADDTPDQPAAGPGARRTQPLRKDPPRSAGAELDGRGRDPALRRTGGAEVHRPRLRPAPTTVMGDRFLLRDLIDNLIDNAIRYTQPHGTVTVRCVMEQEPGQGGGLLVVEDSGPGIAPAKRELVFSRFVRLDDKTTGSGLGLAIVRDIASAHGARIVIDAGPEGRGAIFSVRFPG